MTTTRIVTLGIALAALGMSGCGGPDLRPPATSLTGQVTVDGKAISNGTVTAYKGGSKVMEAPIEVDGTYAIPDPPSGEYQFTVTGTDAPSRYAKPLKLPAKYAKPDASGLTATVTSNQANKQDLALKTK